MMSFEVAPSPMRAFVTELEYLVDTFIKSDYPAVANSKTIINDTSHDSSSGVESGEHMSVGAQNRTTPSPKPAPNRTTPSPKPAPNRTTPSPKPAPNRTTPSPKPGPNRTTPSPNPGVIRATPSPKPGPIRAAPSTKPGPTKSREPTRGAAPIRATPDPTINPYHYLPKQALHPQQPPIQPHPKQPFSQQPPYQQPRSQQPHMSQQPHLQPPFQQQNSQVSTCNHHSGLVCAAPVQAPVVQPAHMRDLSHSSGQYTDSDAHSGKAFTGSDSDGKVKARPPPPYEVAIQRLARSKPIAPTKDSTVATPHGVLSVSDSPKLSEKNKKHVTFDQKRLPKPAEHKEPFTTFHKSSTGSESSMDPSQIVYDQEGIDADNESLESEKKDPLESPLFTVKTYQETDLDDPWRRLQVAANQHLRSREQHARSSGRSSNSTSNDERGAILPSQLHPVFKKQLAVNSSRANGVAGRGKQLRDHSRNISSSDEDSEQIQTKRQSRARSKKQPVKLEVKADIATVHMEHKNPSVENTSKASHIDKIPDELLLHIFSYLPSDQLCQCASVSTRFCGLVWAPSLWSTIKIENKNCNVDRGLRNITRRLSYDTPTVCLMVEKIDIGGCEGLTDKGLQAVAKRCPELRHLNIQGCYSITNIVIFNIISNCVNLEYLNVAGCDQVTCISLTPSANIQAQIYGKQVDLRHLDMSECVNLDDSGLQMIATYCSKLSRLYLRHCENISDIGVQYIANYCLGLRELSVCECRKVSDFGMKELSKLGSKLKYLSIAKCEKITDIGVNFIARNCRKLRYLNMRGCHCVTDSGVIAAVTNCQRLRSLDIGKCLVSDEGLAAIAESSPTLCKLSLKSCMAISDLGLVAVAQGRPNLQQVNIQDCNISVDGYRMVKGLFKRCIIEHTNPAFY